jgi:N-acetylglutamate synthase-like GNAT family acetyltransferase
MNSTLSGLMTRTIYGTHSLDDKTGVASAALIAEVWPDYVALFRREVTLCHSHSDLFEPYFAVAENAGKIIGFSLLMNSMMTTDLLTITWVGVFPEHRGQGIGRKLIALCIEEARRRVKPLVLTTSVPQFYQNLGFRIVDEYNPAKKHFLVAAS